jgi:hypothetical protein
MTTVVAERAAVFTDAALEKHPYFSWGAALAGAFAGGMVAFTLLAIGAGLGLVLVGPVDESSPIKTILTLGGIYFLAVEAFGFAVGGYLAGRLCGPVLQSRGEEKFRSAAHGLVVWALISASSLVFLTVGAMVAAGAAGTTAAVMGVGSAKGPGDEVAPALTAYWADTLLRVPAGPTAMPTPLPDTVPTTPAPTTEPAEPGPDATPAPSSDAATIPPEETAPSEGETAPQPNGGDAAPDTGDQPQPAPNDDEAPPPVPSPAVYVPDARSPLFSTIQYAEVTPAPQITTITASRRIDSEARAEIGRILAANAIAIDRMPAEDRRYIERTIVEQTGIAQADARQRMDALVARVKSERTKVAETARKAGAYIHIWLGLSLLFGLLVAVGAAVLARWEDEEKREEVVVTTARVEPSVPAS